MGAFLTQDVDTANRALNAAYREAHKIIGEQVYSVPLYNLVTFYAASRDLEFAAYPDELPRFWEARWR